ncbi:MAG: hypothetical protein ACI4CS_00085 [Candidatus Weimeria sp.]
MAREEEKDVLSRFDGRGVILKVRQALEIGKMEFSFVSYGTDNKATASVDCYLDAVEFALLMERIRNESLQKAIFTEKQRWQSSGDKYPKEVYVSPIGGSQTKNGAVSRFFSIAPAAKQDVVFRAMAFPASVSQTGAFIAKRGEKPVASIIVSTTFHELAKMAYKWQWLEKDYMSQKYCLKNMANEYRNSHRAENTNGAPEQGVPDNRVTTVEENTGFASADEDTLPFN